MLFCAEPGLRRPPLGLRAITEIIGQISAFHPHSTLPAFTAPKTQIVIKPATDMYDLTVNAALPIFFRVDDYTDGGAGSLSRFGQT